MKKFALAAATAAAALIAAQTASAAIVTVSGAFTATNWSVYFGSPTAPIDPLYMSYSATFDDAITYEADASILTIFSTNVPYPVTFSAASGGGAIVIATAGNSGGCGHPASSFCAFVYDYMTGTPAFVEQSPASGGGWIANTITGGAVPEPATWALLIAGFGMTGYAMRRHTAALAA